MCAYNPSTWEVKGHDDLCEFGASFLYVVGSPGQSRLDPETLTLKK